MNRKKLHISETLKVGILLSVSGGIMDVYSYSCRGNVFANAQTGNMILFGINIFSKNLENSVKYGAPILSFIIGTFFSNFIRYIFNRNDFFHWRQIILLIEILIFSCAAYLSQNLNFIVNNLISFACGLQVEGFRSIEGYGVATTMCIGNLRAGISNFFAFFENRNKINLKISGIHFILIISFIGGALFGDYAITLLKERAILICNIFLILAFYLISTD